MKIQDYSNAMDEIHVNQDILMKNLQEKQISGRTHQIFPADPRIVLAAMLALVLFAGALLKLPLAPSDDGFTITAYAAGSDGVLLSKDPVRITFSSRPLYLISYEGKGEVNYQLSFHCEGDDIASITYRCSDKEITRSDLSYVPCYFVENKTVSIDERNHYQKMDSHLRSMTDTKNGISHIAQLVGNEYTVSYEAQDSISPAIEVRCNTEENSDFTTLAQAEPFTIEVIQKLKDGGTRTRTLLLTPFENASDGLEICILD